MHKQPKEVRPEHPSFPAMLFSRVAATPDTEAFRFPDASENWRSLTWADVGERARAVAGGLLSLGIEVEQRVGVLSSTRLEWILADFGSMAAGAATTTVYPSSTPPECQYILSDSDTQIVFAEDDSQVAKLREVRDQLPSLRRVIVIDGQGDGDWVTTLDELMAAGKEWNEANPGAVDERVESLRPEHLATLIYTSGTTGQPKGVRLLHRCWLYEATAMMRSGLIRADDVQYLWLPLSHSFGKVLLAGQLAAGFATAVDGRIPKLVENLAVVRPTFMAAAPRIFEKVYNKVVSGARDAGGLKLKIFTWAVKVGRQVSQLRQRGEEPTGMLALKYRIADRLVFSKLQATFGGRIRYFISGSAPLSKDIAEFFHAAGILILEGYGLTETSAATFCNRAENYAFGTVGLPLDGTDFRLAEEDGEILIRGDGVMDGYHNKPEATAEVLSDDGWLRTGDIGEVDSKGRLKITDRKKDLIKTSGGKYVAPQLLEGRFKAVFPLVSQIVVHGDKRNFCTAIITLDEERLADWAAGREIAGKSYRELTELPEVLAEVQAAVDEMNKGLASYETIKKFIVLPRDLSIEEGELTPSLKVKRKAVEKKYMDQLDALYEGALV